MKCKVTTKYEIDDNEPLVALTEESFSTKVEFDKLIDRHMEKEGVIERLISKQI